MVRTELGSPGPGQAHSSAEGHGVIARRMIAVVLAMAAGACLDAGEVRVKESDPVYRAVEKAQAELGRRFVNEHGVLLDFVTPNGEVIVPTPEECKAQKPNGLAWWCPIENGAFFNGLYLAGLCKRWRARGKQQEDAESARRIAGGLLHLKAIANTPGFIARGTATDGKSHHSAGSDDQSLPWFYGLWCYARSGIPDEAEKRDIIAAMTDVATAIEKNGWRMPCDPATFGNRGSWPGKSPVSVPRLLFVTRAMHELTGDAHWLTTHNQLRDERPRGSESTRLEICSDDTLINEHGNSKYGYYSFWTKASCQACLAALVEMEDDPDIRKHYEQGRSDFARHAAQRVAEFRKFSNDNTSAFVHDWRVLNEWWKPQKGISDTVAVATEQSKHWHRISPRKRYEARSMAEPLFAAWVVTLSKDRALVAQARDDIRAALAHYDWSRLHYSTFFAAVCTYYEGIDSGL